MPDDALTWALQAWPLVVGALLFGFARRLISPFNRGRSLDFQVTMLRVVVVLYIGLEILDILAGQLFPADQATLSRIGSSLMTVMVSLFAFSVAGHLARRRFGVQRELDGETAYLDNYNSRLVAIVSAVVLFLITVYTLVRIWHLDSLLEATGLLGVIFAFMALTNAIWAPDIYYGLVILNTDMLEGGDTVRFEGETDLYLLHKVTFTHTLLLNVQGNYRSLVRNSRFMERRIDNLTKRASLEGLRQTLHYKVSYPPFEGDQEQRKKAMQDFQHRMEKLREQVMALATEAKLAIKEGLEIRLVNTGDHALDYDIHYYLEPLPVTRVTHRIRDAVLGTHAALNTLVLTTAYQLGLDLRTPLVVATAAHTDVLPAIVTAGTSPATSSRAVHNNATANQPMTDDPSANNQGDLHGS
ncbi:MAG: mechanosensitive ion channel [Spongiibacteraceae bacterium]|jgi:hypothetical protein|nr:mechanosensitive ion channel [Spongiibacteraceae bacterium]